VVRWLQQVVICVGDDERIEVVAEPQFYRDEDGRPSR